MALDWTENENPFVLYMSSGRHDLLVRLPAIVKLRNGTRSLI